MNEIFYTTNKHSLELGTIFSSGFDIKANLKKELSIKKGETVIVPTGIFLNMPSDIDCEVRSRSSLASKGVIITNSPGTIDSDYHEEVKIIMHNLSKEPFVIKDGDRIAQLVFRKKINVIVEEIDEDNKFVKIIETKNLREGGFGSTGK